MLSLKCIASLLPLRDKEILDIENVTFADLTAVLCDCLSALQEVGMPLNKQTEAGRALSSMSFAEPLSSLRERS